jgi:hypothetical protein
MAFGEARLRVDRPGKANYADAYTILAGFLILIAGEVASLKVLLTGSDSGGLHTMTAVSIAYGLAFIVSRFAFQTMQDVREKSDAQRSVKWESNFVLLLTAGVFFGIFLLLGP